MADPDPKKGNLCTTALTGLQQSASSRVVAQAGPQQPETPQQVAQADPLLSKSLREAPVLAESAAATETQNRAPAPASAPALAPAPAADVVVTPTPAVNQPNLSSWYGRRTDPQGTPAHERPALGRLIQDFRVEPGADGVGFMPDNVVDYAGQSAQANVLRKVIPPAHPLLPPPTPPTTPTHVPPAALRRPVLEIPSTNHLYAHAHQAYSNAYPPHAGYYASGLTHHAPYAPVPLPPPPTTGGAYGARHARDAHSSAKKTLFMNMGNTTSVDPPAAQVEARAGSGDGAPGAQFDNDECMAGLPETGAQIGDAAARSNGAGAATLPGTRTQAASQPHVTGGGRPSESPAEERERRREHSELHTRRFPASQQAEWEQMEQEVNSGREKIRELMGALERLTGSGLRTAATASQPVAPAATAHEEKRLWDAVYDTNVCLLGELLGNTDDRPLKLFLNTSRPLGPLVVSYAARPDLSIARVLNGPASGFIIEEFATAGLDDVDAALLRAVVTKHNVGRVSVRRNGTLVKAHVVPVAATHLCIVAEFAAPTNDSGPADN